MSSRERERERERDADEKPSRSKDSKPSKGDNNNITKTKSMKQINKKTIKSEENKRNVKWKSFTKRKFSFGFQHLTPAYVPSMSDEPRGYSICLQKVNGWTIPSAIIKEFGSGDYEITAQLSLSLYHLSSSTFFGTTWMGPSISLGLSDSREVLASKVIDFEYQDIVYLISRITDPTCVAILEIVVSKYDLRHNLVSAQFGAGWTMINLFMKPPPIDISRGHENVDTTTCSVFTGSPRSLIVNQDVKTLASKLKEIPSCSLHFRLFSHKRLLQARKLIAENQAVGRYDVIAGLIPQLIIPPGKTTERLIACIGDEELIREKIGTISIPTTPKLAIDNKIEVNHFTLTMTNRRKNEMKMIEVYSKMLNIKESSAVQVISRKLKLGLHNGNTVVGGDWLTFKLLEDSDDKDVLYVDPDDKIVINGFVADVLMSLALIVEYDLGTPVSRETHFNSYAMMKSTSWVNGRTITSFTVGATIFIPFNGERLLLQNTDRSIVDDNDDSLNIELELRSDEICMILGAKPLIFDNIDEKSSSMPREIDAMNRLSLKAADKNDSSKVTMHQQQLQQQSFDGENKTMIGFDLVVIHPKKGRLEHEQNMLDLLAEDNRRRLVQAAGSEDDDGDGRGTKLKSGEKDDDKGVDDGSKKDKDAKRRSDSDKDNKKLKVQSTKGFSVTKQDVKAISSSKDKDKVKGKAYDADDDDDIQSIADSIVAGDSENSSLRLDALYYTSIGYTKDVNKFEWDVVSEESSQLGGGIYPDRLDRAAYRGIGFYAPNDRNSLLAQSLQLKLVSQDHSGMTMLKERSELIGVRDGKSNINQNEMLRIAPKTVVSINSNTSHMRDITRGAKSRLSRYGIDSALIDTPLEAILGGSNNHNIDDNRRSSSSSKGKNIVVDIDLEARDELNLHEINIQFAGYRAGSKVVVVNNTTSTTNDMQSMKHFEYSPKAIYFSFQFYSCMPTRTEVMRLIPADNGQICVLARDEAYARDDPPLSLRYLIDCSTASPHEAVEFAEYLATCSLYIDVFDADSLLHIGTCGIPLRRLMRQGQVTMKMAVECDVINAELMSCQGQSDLNSNVIADGGPMEGLIVGAVQLVLTNHGQHGSNRSNSGGLMKVKELKNNYNNEDDHVDEMNWRAFGIQKSINNNNMQQQQQYLSSNRPRNSVRAKPLLESAPELSKALSDARQSSTSDSQQYSGASLRSLTATRGGPGLCTLTYDEVAIIFRRFRGPLKGTCQYAGDLLALLDMPSLSIALKKLVHAYSAFGDYEGLMKEILRYSNAASELKTKDLEEFLHSMFEKTGVKCRSEEITMIAEKILEHGVDKHIGAMKAIEFCAEEADRHEWTLVGSRLRLAAQKATISGVDIEDMLSNYDVNGTHHININKFKEFLRELSKYINFGIKETNLCCRHFSRRPKSSEIDRDPVSLKEVLAFLGIEYVGNLQLRIRQIISQKHNVQDGAIVVELPTVKEILHLLNSIEGSIYETKDNQQHNHIKYSYEHIETMFSMLGVHKHLSHDQIRAVVRKIDTTGQGKITAAQVLNYLGVPYKASDLTFIDTAAEISKPVAAVVKPVDVGEILRILFEKIQTNGAEVIESFRHFDTDGDGSISKKELMEGLSKLGIFNNVPNWKKQIPLLIKKIDVDGDDDIQLREFFALLNITDYSPNIIQRMTKIFAIATQKKVSIKDIFKHLDTDNSGQLDSNELEKGLKSLGTFDEITMNDIESVINHFDKDGDKLISIDEFVQYFTDRVNKCLNDRRMKHAYKVAMILRKTMTGVVDKGVTLRSIFGHLDKDKSGSIGSQELADAIKKMPSFKDIKEQDIKDLMKQLDEDGNGQITFDEFEHFVMNVNNNDIADHDSNDDSIKMSTTTDDNKNKSSHNISLIERLRNTFQQAEKKGLSFQQAFQLIDKDKNDELSKDELIKVFQVLPGFQSITSNEVNELMKTIDKNNNGTISIEEFHSYVKDGKVSNRTLKSSSSLSSDMMKGSSRFDKDYAKELFIRHVKRISQVDGSISALLAYLDDDEDGLIGLSTFKTLLRREDVFDTLPENEVILLLEPLMHDSKMIRVSALLRYIEGNQIIKLPVSITDDDKEVISIKEYVFSTDPEIRSLEKKIRSFGRILSKKGIDVEGLFKQYDPTFTGSVRRTALLEVFSKLGMYILEQGKIMDQAVNSEHDVQRLQMHQVNRLKGKGGGYAYNAPRMARRMLMNGGVVQPDGDFKDHLESLTLINWYRQSQKQMLLQRVLSHSLAHTIRIYPRFGKTCFFEYAVTNPFAHEERFQIEINDPELRLVTAFDEWIHLRRTCRPSAGEYGGEPIEVELFDKIGEGNIQVVLLPHETLYIPFSFMTLIPYVPEERSSSELSKRKRLTNISGSNAESKSTKSKEKESKFDSKDNNNGDDDDDHYRRNKDVVDHDDEEPRKVVEVKFISGTHGHVISILKVLVCPRPFILHRVLRFQEPENSIMKRRIQIVGHENMSIYPGEFTNNSKFIHCVERTIGASLNNQEELQSRVVVEWGPTNEDFFVGSGALDVMMRYRCGAFPFTGYFYLLIYNDPYQCQLHEIWQVVVQTRQRLDIHSTVGSTASSDLVIRGDRFARRAKAFELSSTADTLRFKPETVFQLVPGAYNRVSIHINPKVVGYRQIQVNLVDVDSRELISAWLVMISSTSPAIMRTYDVEVSTGAPLHKKIIFKNPWDMSRKFVLSSSNESLMRVKAPLVDVAGNGNAYLRLIFSGVQLGSNEVYLFLNDANGGQNEECYLFRIRNV